MDKKDFIFPGVILGLVIVTGLGLLLTHTDTTKLIPTEQAATSTTASSSTSNTSAIQPPASTPSTAPHGPYAYYPYGMLTLSMDQAAVFKDGISIRPVDVSQDSRCPSGVQCIQAGTVMLTLKISVNGESHTQTFQLGHSITAGADTVMLDAVSPERSKDATPTQGSYRFTFTVTHGSGMAARPCYVGGCSAQFCTDSPGAISTCEYTARYACYKTATCERQSNGACGWTQTDTLKACLANPPQE